MARLYNVETGIKIPVNIIEQKNSNWMYKVVLCGLTIYPPVASFL